MREFVYAKQFLNYFNSLPNGDSNAMPIVFDEWVKENNPTVCQDIIWLKVMSIVFHG